MPGAGETGGRNALECISFLCTPRCLPSRCGQLERERERRQSLETSAKLLKAENATLESRKVSQGQIYDLLSRPLTLPVCLYWDLQHDEVESVRRSMDDMFKESLADWESRIRKANMERDEAVEEARVKVKAAEEAQSRYA